MSILGICNRSENWKTAWHFAPMFRDKSLLLKLVREMGEHKSTSAEDVHIELFWKGMRDHLAKSGQKQEGSFPKLAELYENRFKDLRDQVKRCGRFRELRPGNYAVPRGEIRTLGNNLVNTEIDIVVHSPQFIYIGEAKGEMSFNTDSKRALVHQLIRQYVMARVLVDLTGCKREVVQFVVGGNKDQLKKTHQVEFVQKQGWLRDGNILTWKDIDRLTHDG